MRDYVKEMHDYSDVMKDMEKNLFQMELKDKTAKSKKKLVGRYIRERYADGYAYYEIVKENKHTMRIKVITGIGDDWYIPYWGKTTTISKEYVLNNISWRDNMSELFGKKESER